MMRHLPSVIALCTILVHPAMLKAANSGSVERGEAFARKNCSTCHAIGKEGDSALKEAPPFRMLSARYPIEDLGEALAEGIVTGHPSMPVFQLDAQEIFDLIAYLNELSNR